jgi:branched-chain amino acid transport system substrate-binding protein
VVVGAVYNLSGPQAVLDVPAANGARLAADRINAGSGVLGRRLMLAELDGKSSPDVLEARTRDLLRRNPSTVALLGLSDTDMVLAAARVASKYDRVFLTSGATSPKLPYEVPVFLFLACFGDNVQAAAGAEWAYHDLSARKAAVLFDPDASYTRLLQEYFVRRFTELGGSVLSVESLKDDTPASGIIPADADLVFLAAETAEDAARVIPTIRGAGFSGPILGGDGFDAEPVWAGQPDVSEVYFTTHVYLGADSPSTEAKQFLEAYSQSYRDRVPSAFSALGYDAVGLLAEAISRAGSTDPEAVREALSKVEDYVGVTGTIGFTSESRIPRKSVTILQVSGGELKLVRQLLPKSVPMP